MVRIFYFRYRPPDFAVEGKERLAFKIVRLLPDKANQGKAMETEEQLRNLTPAECQKMADALFEDAGALPPGPEQEATLRLAHGYLNLAKIKGLIDKETN